jgi:hypothetical protein
MIALLWLLLAILALPFKSKCQLEAENVTLPHQVVVLRRRMRDRVRLTDLDRLVLSNFTAGFRQPLGGQTPFLAGFITIIVEFKFSAHTPPERNAP